MSHKPDADHAPVFPEALEAFLARIGELRGVLGPAQADGAARLEATVAEALAARDRGDVRTAVTRIVEAMRLLAVLAGASGTADGPALATVADRFAAALSRGALDDARAAADVMRVESGTTLRPRSRS